MTEVVETTLLSFDLSDVDEVSVRDGSLYRQIRFLTDRYGEPVKPVLHAPCGSGRLASSLQQRGWTVWSTEPDEARAERLQATYRDLKVLHCGMADVGRTMESGSLAGIICPSNHLARARSEQEMETVLGQFADVLEESGFLVIEIDNYSSILHKRIRNLPLWQSQEGADEVMVLQQYEMDGTKVNKHRNIFTRSDAGAWTVLADVHEVTPLEHSSLIVALREHGFTDIQLFGSFDGEEYRALESPKLVCTAVKGKREEDQ